MIQKLNQMPFLDYSQFIQTIIIGAGGLATAIISIHTIWKKILKPWFTESRIKRDNLARVIAHIEDISVKLENISKELQPNGGGSIKDQVKEISKDVKAIRVERDATFLLAKEPMFKNDASGYCILANQALCKLYGTTQEQLLGLGWLNFINEDDRERVKDEWKNIMESGTEITSSYTIINQSTDEEVPVRYRAIINRDNDKIISALGYVEKINYNKFNNKVTKNIA